jgi:hypothetical protein
MRWLYFSRLILRPRCARWRIRAGPAGAEWRRRQNAGRHFSAGAYVNMCGMALRFLDAVMRQIAMVLIVNGHFQIPFR